MVSNSQTGTRSSGLWLKPGPKPLSALISQAELFSICESEPDWTGAQQVDGAGRLIPSVQSAFIRIFIED